MIRHKLRLRKTEKLKFFSYNLLSLTYLTGSKMKPTFVLQEHGKDTLATNITIKWNDLYSYDALLLVESCYEIGKTL